MSAFAVILWGFIILCVAFGLFVVLYASQQIFINTLYRSPKKERTRSCTDETQQEMFDRGIKWAENYKNSTVELHIINDGLNLYGEYIDLGYDRCAVIVQGRTESLLYSYYYAGTYAKCGYNILVIDTRAHGLSDGKFITAGVLEHRDLIMWIELIKSRYFITSFVIHGICIGAATALFAYSATKKDGLIKKIVMDGVFTNYYEIFKNHIIEKNRPVLFFVYLEFFYTYLFTGANMLKVTPYKYISEIDIPVLFIWSTKDIYCTMDKNNELFEACKSEHKEIKLFPNGRHSFVRFNNEEEYDKTIIDFLKK